VKQKKYKNISDHKKQLQNKNMQLMTFNSLLMFDIVFVFFLFLVGVTCLVYYLPPNMKKTSYSGNGRAGSSSSSMENTTYHDSRYRVPNCRENLLYYRTYDQPLPNESSQLSGDTNGSGVGGSGSNNSSTSIEIEKSGPTTTSLLVKKCSCSERVNVDSANFVQIEIERTRTPKRIYSKINHNTNKIPQCCYVKAKDCDIKECTGPIHNV
jgi:hypothetical protein